MKKIHLLALAAVLFLGAATLQAQTPEINGPGTGAIGAAANSSFSLSDRFQSAGSDRFSQGSQAIGQTTAALLNGGGAFGNTGPAVGFGTGGFGGGFTGRSALGLGVGLGNGFQLGFGTQNLGAQQNQQTQQKTTRVRLVLGFTAPKRNMTQINTANARWKKAIMRRIPSAADSVQAAMDGSTLVLQGTVPTDSDRNLVELLAKLEPGVGDVRNEIQVAVPPAVPED